jgi:hypothetical protein
MVNLHKLKAFENNVLRRIFGHRRGEAVTEGCRMLQEGPS